MSCLAHGAREAGPDHRVACHQSRKRCFAQTLGSRGPLGNHQIAHFGGRVPDSDLRARRQGHAKLREYPARVSDHAGTIRCALVPDRWQSQDRPRVATAERADNHVVSAGRVRDGNHVLTLPTRVAKLRNSSRRIAQQAFTERRIDPSARDNARAIARTHFRLIGVNQYVECGRIDVALLGHHRLERADAPLDVTEFAVFFLQGVLPSCNWAIFGQAPWAGSPETLRRLYEAQVTQHLVEIKLLISWRSLRDSNPCYSLERAMSWASRRRERDRGLGQERGIIESRPDCSSRKPRN